MIPVTKPFLPPLEEYKQYVEQIFNRNWMTNNGPLVNELEIQLKKYLDVNHLLFLGNGTLALQLAIKALDIKNEVITTPFSYIATMSSIVWEGCKPVFADIDSRTLNLNPEKIEHKISKNTTAILATHCFGNPCDIEAISEISSKYNLKVIYDGAHCFGTQYNDRSIFEFGDVSICSFHATKLFQTVEGGAVFTQDPELLKTMAYMRNFGHKNAEEFFGLGINAKNSEFHAAMGLCNIKYIDSILEKRKEQSAYYDELIVGLRVTKPLINQNARFNYSYYPIIFQTEEILIRSKTELEKSEIYPRRYFYPTLNKVQYVNGDECPVSEDLSKRILCLPLYHELSREEQRMIARILLRVQNHPVK